MSQEEEQEFVQDALQKRDSAALMAAWERHQKHKQRLGSDHATLLPKEGSGDGEKQRQGEGIVLPFPRERRRPRVVWGLRGEQERTAQVVQELRAGGQSCLKCKGAGYIRNEVPYGHPNFGKPLLCSCKEATQKAKQRKQLLELSNLEAFRKKTFASFNRICPGMPEIYKAAWNYAVSPSAWLLLIGAKGTGKTHLAAAIANSCLEWHEGMSVLFLTVPDLLDHLRAAFGPNSQQSYDQLFATVREVDLLVLDDLGAQQGTDWANEKLFQLLNHRYNLTNIYVASHQRRRGATVITTNCHRLCGIDERIRSRLADKAVVQEVSFEHIPDYRPNNVWTPEEA